jgi:phosphoglycolate phosphatase
MTAVNQTMVHYGFPVKTREEVRMAVGHGAWRLIADVLPESEVHRTDEILETYKKYYAACCQEQTKPYEGVVEALEQLKKKYKIAVVSNKPDPAVKHLCAQYFGDVYALGEAPDCPRKPAPDMLYKAMKEIGADRCIYVGDSEVDVLTAKNAGAECLSVTWGFRDEAVLVEAGAKHLCRDSEQLAQALLEML